MKRQRLRKIVIRAVKSKIITSGDSMDGILKSTLKKGMLKEGDILVISSKILAITQKKIKKNTSTLEFNKLVQAEADQVIGGKKVTLTLKDHILMPWAGIDRSNVPQGKAVLLPAKPFQAAYKIAKFLKKNFRLKKLGILITDSFCVPLRRGVTGVAIGYAGFHGVIDLRGHADIYGKKLQVTQQALADSLAAASHVVMGESNEQTPFAIITGAPVKFTSAGISPSEPLMEPKYCLFEPLYRKIFKNL